MEKDQGVIVAKSAGFCPGVKGAIDKVLELEASGKKPIYTLGPLIHNKQVTDMLAAKQITSVDTPAQATDKSGVLVIRAHGITPAFRAEVMRSGMEVVDATCPLVKHAHDVISKYADQGYSTVIVGDSGHAEVLGLLGSTQGKGVVVSGPEEAKKLPHFDKVNVVSQTTQKESVFLETAEIIKAKADVCQISNTICHPTKLRQSETVELAKNADLVIVVGGKHSANTTRLALLCQELAPQVLHIETETDLTEQQVLAPKHILITAGASTPNWVINQVTAWVRSVRQNHFTQQGE
ncbi:MAG: 4-hydroxy-3-methylbut-2-enyl diphosphate reductase [Elusimicrobiaceae bacterium]|nr:4-hydroxy-3-methylbut-2-enyl diphosphate reductase [Elusimicrobiaceae bacterium]